MTKEESVQAARDILAYVDGVGDSSGYVRVCKETVNGRNLEGIVEVKCQESEEDGSNELCVYSIAVDTDSMEEICEPELDHVSVSVKALSEFLFTLVNVSFSRKEMLRLIS